jgi:hypothetical protein
MCPTALDELWTTGIKKCLAALDTQLGSRVYKARSCITEVPAEVSSAQLTTPGHGYRGDTTRQDGTTVRAMFSATER